MRSYRTRSEAEAAAIRASVLEGRAIYLYTETVWVITDSIDEASFHDDAEVIVERRPE